VFPPVTPVAPPPAVAKVEPKSCSVDDQCSSKQLCVRSRCAAITPALEECGVNRVHFDFDKATLQAAELPALERVSRCLKADQRIHVLIEGNADDRGSIQYNLGLGDRRASAVEDYLVGLGVPRAQLSTATYGKELPLCSEDNEACWAENRRASLQPGGVPKVVPGEKQYEARKAAMERKQRHASAAMPEAHPTSALR
jgi:outer membrane protein OmpA-like peptidoglycan-associated protein